MTETTAAELEGIVVADASIKGLVTKYRKAKGIEDDAKNEVERLRKLLNAKFEDAGAAKFTDTDGDPIASRSMVNGPELVDVALLKRIAPEVYAQVVKPRTKFYRVTLPRLRRR